RWLAVAETSRQQLKRICESLPPRTCAAFRARSIHYISAIRIGGRLEYEEHLHVLRISLDRRRQRVGSVFDTCRADRRGRHERRQRRQLPYTDRRLSHLLPRAVLPAKICRLLRALQSD